MSNKSQLQSNNETLASILSNVLGLPSQESLKYGAYVWKKCNKSKITFTCDGTAVIQVSSNDIDLSTYTASSFEGYKGAMDGYANGAGTLTGYEFVISGSTPKMVVKYGASSGYYANFSYDATTHKITITDIGITANSMEDVTIVGSFVDYVVSDSPTAYPDGGEQDGYWYEKVVEEIDMDKLAILLGCSNVAVDKFTFTSDTGMGTSINHTLGIIPKLVMVLTTGITSSMKNSNYWKDTVSFKDSGHSVMRYWNNNGVEVFSHSTSVYAISTSKTISFTGGYQNYQKYKAGIEYTLITMA